MNAHLLDSVNDPDLTLGSTVLCHETDAHGSLYRLGTVQGFGTLGGRGTIRVTFPGIEGSSYLVVETDETLLITNR